MTPAVAWVYLAAGAALTLAALALLETELAHLPVTVAGVAAAVAAVRGVRGNRPRPARPWHLLTAACIAFVVGAGLRQVSAGTPWSWVADVASLSGYGALLAGFLGLLMARRSGSGALHDVIDAAIVLVSGSALAVQAFTLPTVEKLGVSLSSLVQGGYPVVDAMLVFVAVLLSWTSAVRAASFWLLGSSVLFVLVGDIGYAVIATEGRTVGSPLLDVPFVIAFSLFGASVLHPSMRQLSSVQQRPVPAWSASRMALLTPMLAIPPALSLLTLGLVTPWIGAVSGLVVTALLVGRAFAAVHDHARAQEGLRYQARHDPLTQLPNRNGLIEAVDSMVSRAALRGDVVELLLLDLDAFKLVNDTWGHLAGDRVIKQAAHRLRGLAHPGDVVARIAGDEFAIARYLSRGSADTSADEFADTVVQAFRTPLLAQELLVVTASAGIASTGGSPAGAEPHTAESLLRDADTAMYRAKETGRNRCMEFDPSMHASVRRRVEMELALRLALERQELVLHYQPIVSLATGEVVGAEALVRWAHPTLGLVSPMDFIPIAEETGLIVDIGEWVLTEAVEVTAAWNFQRAAFGIPPLWVSVNVSQRQLHDGRLIDHVMDEVGRAGLPPELLVLEITESAMMADERQVPALLERLRGIGVHLAVDDFGTGYSSLGYLRRFPVSKVKVDRAFIAGIEIDPEDAEIVRAVVAMSLAMRLEVVAEGVETQVQRDMLTQLDVHYGQGWFFGRPVPAEACAFVPTTVRVPG